MGISGVSTSKARNDPEAHGYRVVYHVPPTPAFFSYTVSWTFGIFCGDLRMYGRSVAYAERRRFKLLHT